MGHHPEANKIKASGDFFARDALPRIVINGEKLGSTPITTPIIYSHQKTDRPNGQS
jgi:hypothetical protein